MNAVAHERKGPVREKRLEPVSSSHNANATQVPGPDDIRKGRGGGKGKKKERQ